MRKVSSAVARVVLVALVSVLVVHVSAAELSAPEYIVIEELGVMVKMRDGVRLSTNIYRPDSPGEFPVLLMRTPYGNENIDGPGSYFFAQRGYVVIIQDCRGRYESEGVFDPMQTEALDGYDTQQWIGGQQWCNGKIGTYGGSYVGYTQWSSAPLRSPYLVTMIPVVTTSDFYHMAYYDGAFRLRMWDSWSYLMTMPYDFDGASLNERLPEIEKTLPLIEQDREVGWPVPFLRTWLRHPEADDYWNAIRMGDGFTDITASSLSIGGWFDICLKGTLDNFIGMNSPDIDPAVRKKQKLLIGPWVHSLSRDGKVGDTDFGEDAVLDMNDTRLRWFDAELKGNDTGIWDEPPVKIYVMGDNVWRDENEWPLARTDYRKFYFDSRGHANTLSGDGTLGSDHPDGAESDTFVYDPDDPVPSSPDSSPFLPMNNGPRDHTAIERRQDVLVYSTPPLDNDMEVTGPVEVILYAASTAPNTDFTAKLLDVYPDGRSMYLCDGIVRASFRDGYLNTSNIEPGTINEYRIDLWATSNVFKKGHRIRVEISSSNFPRFDRNLNTGADFATGTACVKATQTVYHDEEHPSCIVLPVIPQR